MLTATYTVEVGLSGDKDKADIRDVNIDDEYREEKKVDAQIAREEERKAT